MDYLVIEGVPPWDGRYEFDLEGAPITVREWGWIKRHSGYLPLTIDDGINGADPELFTVFAVIVLHRARRIRTTEVSEQFERFADTAFDSAIRLDTATEAEGDSETEDPTSASESASGSTFGPPLPMPSEQSETPPSVIGMPASDILESDSPRLAS